MTFNQGEDHQGADEGIDTYGLLGVDGCDGILSLLVSATDRSGAEVPITLTVKGVIVTGLLTSEHIFFDEMARLLSSERQSNATDVLISSFLAHSESSRQKAAYQSAEKVKLAFPFFIHIRNAKFCLSDNQFIPVNSGLLWRGRLDMVDSFSYGSLGSST